MRRKIYLLVVLLVCCSLLAKNHDWITARLVRIVPNTNSGVAAIPIGTMIVGAPISVTRYTYVFEAPGGMSYALYDSKDKAPLDLTLNGSAKLSIEGRDALLVDDSGKQHKLRVVGKKAPE